jgi:hypothetical protein
LADTGFVSSNDSLFDETLGALSYEDTINIDSLLDIYSVYDDTLLFAIDKEIEKFRKNTYIQWIKLIKNDTIDFYIVNIEGDSLLVRLYKNSPHLIQFSLTDYWGTKIPAVIRDIDKKSFRILVDDAPEIHYQTAEKAKKAIGGLGKIPKKRNLTIEPIPIELNKPKWIFGGNTNLDMSQIGMYQWAQGGEPNIAILGGLELFINYKKDHKSFENKARFRYGLMRQGRYAEDSIPFRSTEDRLEFASKYGYKAFGQFYITLAGDFKSQFAPNHTYDKNIKGEMISDFMSPAYLTFSLGLDYKPNENTSLFLSPIGSKSTIVLDTSNELKARYSVDTNSNVRNELGIGFKGWHKIEFWGDIEMKNSLELFSNYLDRPENVDVNWEFSLVFPVNDFIRATIATNLKYDDNIDVPKYRKNELGEDVRKDGPGGQFREIITIGFAIKF